jgi:prevent-host-death family protein
MVYILYMSRLPLSEVRRRLPALVREAAEGRSVQITNRGRVVACLVPPANDAATTADVILAIRARTPRPRRRSRSNVSGRKNQYLTGIR